MKKGLNNTIVINVPTVKDESILKRAIKAINEKDSYDVGPRGIDEKIQTQSIPTSELLQRRPSIRKYK